jgi:hypothetical protein
MALPEAVLEDRTGFIAPLIRPWAPLVRTRGVLHWCDPSWEPEGFVCPNVGDQLSRSIVVLAQDVLIWDPREWRWREGKSPRTCGICLPHGVRVTREPPAWRRLVTGGFRVAESLAGATAAKRN